MWISTPPKRHLESEGLGEDLAGRSVETEPVLGTPEDMLLNPPVKSCLEEELALGRPVTSPERAAPSPLSCLQTPLLTLEICSRAFLDTDITYLSQSFHATCLKKLDLSGDNLSHVVPGPLETLPEEVSGTLQHLDLNHCWIKDAHLSAILPALCHCSHLSSLGLSDNPVSRAGLLSLLQHTAELTEPKQVLYFIPIEGCVYLHVLFWGPINKGKLYQM